MNAIARAVLLCGLCGLGALGPASRLWAQDDRYRAASSRGMEAAGEGRFADAVQAYAEALGAAADDRQRAQALIAEGEALTLLNRPADAAEVLGRAGRLAGASGEQRARAWRGAAQAAGAVGLDALAVEANGWLAESPAAPEVERAAALARLGDLQYAGGDRRSAAITWRRLASQYPRAQAAQSARQRLANAAAEAGDLDGLLKLLTETAAAGLPDAEGLYVLAASRLADGDHPAQALRVVEALLAWRPSSEAGWSLAWRLHGGLGDADAFLARAMARARRDAQVAGGLAGVAEALASSPKPEQRARALDLYAQLIATAGSSRRLLYGASRAALEAGKVALAEGWSAALLSAQPGDVSAQALRSRVLAAGGRREEALGLLKRLAHYSPSNRDSARRLLAMLDEADLDDAAADVVREVRGAAGDPRALAADLFFVHQRAGRWTDALRELAAALESGEASPGYATSLAYQWLTEPAGLEGAVAAMDALAAAQKLPEALAAPHICALLMRGREADAQARLAALPGDRRGPTAIQTAQLLSLLGRDDLVPPIYEQALAGPLAPETEAEVALRLAEDLRAAGRVADARRLLEAHRRPALPQRVALPYDLALAEVLVAVGDLDGAERLLAEGRAVGLTRSPSARLLVGECAFRRGDYAAARRALLPLAAGLLGGAEAAPQPPPEPDLGASGPVGLVPGPVGPVPEETAARAAFLLAEVALREGKGDGARKGYLALLAAAPETEAATLAVGRLSLLAAMAGLGEDDARRFRDGLKALDSGDAPQARSLWATWWDAPGDPLGGEVRLLLAEGLATRDPSAAAVEYEALADAAPTSPAAASALLRAAGLRAATEPATAVRLAKRVEEQHADSALAPLAAAMAEELTARLPPR